MNKKVLIKFFCIIILAIILLMNIPVISKAETASQKYMDIYSDETFESKLGDKTMSEDFAGNDVKKFMNRIISVVQVIGVFIAVTMLVFLGVKYMYASPGDRAQIKNHITVYVIGASIMFGATGILQMVKDFFLEATK